MKYLVSVIIPIYNGEKTMEKAINSVVGQSIFDRSELLLLDDGSSDNSIKIAKEYSKSYNNIFVYINKKNLGISKNQNKGLKLSRGEFIARLDQDDLWTDNRKLEEQVKVFQKNKDIGLVGTWVDVINNEGKDFKLTPPSEDKLIRSKMLMASMFISPSIMFRKDLVEKIGFYDESLKYGTEDYEYWLRIGKVAKFLNIPKTMMTYSFHAGSYSNKNKAKAIKEHVLIIKRYRNYYPGFPLAFLKNWIQYNLLKIRPLYFIYNKAIPLLAGKIYS